MGLGGKSSSLDEALGIINNSIHHHDEPSKPFKRKLVWTNVAVYIVGHILGLWGFKLWLCDITWTHFILTYAIGYFINLNGILMGAHRYYAHRCFKASKALQLLMIASQTAASQNCLWVWVRDHRQHHKYSDTDADPHNATNGFFFSHVGWLLSKKHPDVIEKGKGIDMSDLEADPLVMFQKRHYKKLWLVFAIILPILFPVFVLGEPWWYAMWLDNGLRIVVILHITWFVNSWAHAFGNRPFDKNIVPVESKFVSFITMGEGWHNYHHTFPYDYKTSEFGARYNVTAKLIRLCARYGFAWDLKEPTNEMVIARSKRTGDGSPILTHLQN